MPDTGYTKSCPDKPVSTSKGVYPVIERRKALWIGIFLLFSVFLLYRRVLSYHFVSIDDPVYVSANSHIKAGLSFANIKWAFTTFEAEFWHPITWLSLMLDTSLYGVNPGGYHFTNILLHALNALAVFLLFNRMTGAPWKSALVAGLFALHPINVEPVAWISSRKDVLGTFFALLSLWAYVACSKKKKRSYYFLCLFFFSMSLMAKSLFVTVPILMLILDYRPLGRLNPHSPGSHGKIYFRRALFEKIPFLGLSAAFGILSILAQEKGGGLIALSDFPLSSRITNAALAYPAYLKKLFWPTRLACIYPLKMNPSVLTAVFSMIFLLGILAFSFHLRRNHGYLLFGWLWFLCALLPVSGLIKVGDFFIADRYAYFSFIGLYVFMIWGACEFFDKLNIPGLFSFSSALVIITFLALFSYKQIGYWKNSLTLFSHAVHTTKNNHLAHHALARLFAQGGKLQAALPHFQEAVRLKPDRVQYRLDLGRALAAAGRFKEAVPVLRRLTRHRRCFPEPYYYLGLCMTALGLNRQALNQFYHAFRLNTFSIEDSIVGIDIHNGSNPDTRSFSEEKTKKNLSEKMLHCDKTSPLSKRAEAMYRVAESYLNQKKTDAAFLLFHIQRTREWLKKAAEKGYKRWPLSKP